MSKFIALPVGQGDAFYLERHDFRVLVDGGRSESAISGLVSHIAKTKSLDAVVCTHNDADHADGIIGLLDNWDGVVREVWLPGSWTYRMNDLFQNPIGFCRELVENISQDNGDARSLEELQSNIDSPTPDSGENNKSNLADIFEGAKTFPDHTLSGWCFECPQFEPFFFSCKHQLYMNGGNRLSLFMDGILAAGRIKKIAELAYHRGCNIRFFEFGDQVSGGEKGQLEPINSNEIITIRPKAIGALFYLRLTIDNTKSLVFFSPESRLEPAVMFTADSDLKYIKPNSIPTRQMIVTSPHHGSDHNKNAYIEIISWLGAQAISPIWVRSDCKSNTRPGISFKTQLNKACTLCNCGSYPKQTVQLHTQKHAWRYTKGTRRCSCK